MDLDIQQRLSAIEEQLDKLDHLIDGFDPTSGNTYSENAAGILEGLGVIRECNLKVAENIEENVLWDKSFPLDLIMQRLLKFVVREADQRKIKLTIAQSVEGRIPHSMAEIVMTSVMAGLRIVLDRISNTDQKDVRKDHRLKQRCMFVQMIGDRDTFYVRIMDDCSVRRKPARQEIEFQRVREAVSHKEGVCNFNFRKNYGFELVLKAPMPQTKTEAFMLDGKHSRYGVLSSLVIDVIRDVSQSSLFAGEHSIFLDYKNEKIPLCYVSDSDGLMQVGVDEGIRDTSFSVIVAGAADIIVAIVATDNLSSGPARLANADRFLSATSWYSRILIKQDLENYTIYPLLDGRTMLARFNSWSDAS